MEHRVNRATLDAGQILDKNVLVQILLDPRSLHNSLLSAARG